VSNICWNWFTVFEWTIFRNTASQKKETLYCYPWLHQMLTNFHISVTCSRFVIVWSSKIPPDLKCVAALPTSVSENSESRHVSPYLTFLSGKVAAALHLEFCSQLCWGWGCLAAVILPQPGVLYSCWAGAQFCWNMKKSQETWLIVGLHHTTECILPNIANSLHSDQFFVVATLWILTASH